MAFLDSLIGPDGKIELNKFDGTSLLKPIVNYDNNRDSTKVCFLDLETTGLNKNEDKIIDVVLILIALSFLLIISALFNGMKCLYFFGILALASIPYWGWHQLENNILFPIVSSAGGIGFVFSGLIVCIQIFTNNLSV